VRKFQAFYAQSFLGILHIDTTGSALHANDAWTEITGREPGESLGRGWVKAIHADDRNRVLAEWIRASSAGGEVDVSFRVLRPDGTRRYVRLRGRPLPPEMGEDDCYVGVVLDLTERVLAERRLQRNNELLSSVLENIPCGVTVFDHDGSLVLDNQKFRALLAVPEGAPEGVVTDFGTMALDSDMQGLAYPNTGHPATAGADFDPAPRVREELQPDGRVLEVRDAHMPTGGLVTTYTDITQHKQIIDTLQHAKAAAEQAAAAKAAFLAAMSHEIRTPMNGVIGMTSVLLSTRLTPDQRELVDVIRQSGELLLVVINDILDYSRFESGQMELEWLPLRLEDVVDNSVRLLGARAQAKQVPIAVDIAPDIPALILGDRNRLQQVLVNLVSNAVKFTAEGGIRISVRNTSAASAPACGDLTGDLCTLTVCVEDTGIGIAGDKLDTIFEPFVQADSSTARCFGGTGLGLAIARRLAQAMGGSVEIESELGVGTKVRFSFLTETAVPRSRAGANGQAPLSGRRVLLVSGSRSDVGLLVLQLKRWGMEYRLCDSRSEALALLANDKGFDLVLAATHFVDSRGLDFVRELRAAGVTAPTVLLSRKGRTETVDVDLLAWTVPRSTTESTLYDALVDAAHHCSEPAVAEEDPVSVFDESLAERAPLRILVAEDNEINRKVALRMLGAFGYRPDVAHDGEQVLEAVRARPYDLVLMDIQMPRMDGIEATRFIVETIPPARRPRIVAMSANVMREEVEAALDAGADDYIGKPFPAAELRAALQRAAERNPEAVVRLPPNVPAEPRLVAGEKVRAYLRTDANGAFLEGLVATFVTMSQDLLVKLRDSLREEDAVAAGARAHELAGMCAVLGAEKLMALAQELQGVAAGGHLQGAAALLQRCEAAREETIAALGNALSTHRASPVA
jgi:PAS domain S-box-containing protein